MGSNGAGKSTLLKILSRITEPTTGRVGIRGRVGSLLEVGTGFHPELTGRENTYLNGAILGMGRREIDRKFDEIVAFAEVEKFVDTPVKHYSSGMRLRLAFAVAAHLEPEILIVDEVLAVGDASFQKKCLGKMGNVAAEGRTVLFVSHDLDAVQRLCTRSLLLARGRIADEGRTREVVSAYLSRHHRGCMPGERIDLGSADRLGSGEVRFIGASYQGDSVGDLSAPLSEGALHVRLELRSDRARSLPSLAVVVYTQDGLKLINADSLIQGKTIRLQRGLNQIEARIQAVHLSPGSYVIGLWAAEAGGHVFDFIQSAFEIRVAPAADGGFGRTAVAPGLVPCDYSFNSEPKEIRHSTGGVGKVRTPGAA
jgi:lipopolysaccharide transport system ATP-binding protein